MTGRERVTAAVAGKEPDRVPIDLGGTESSGLTGIAWHRLIHHLGGEAGRGPEVIDPRVRRQVVRLPLCLALRKFAGFTQRNEPELGRYQAVLCRIRTRSH